MTHTSLQNHTGPAAGCINKRERRYFDVEASDFRGEDFRENNNEDSCTYVYPKRKLSRRLFEKKSTVEGRFKVNEDDSFLSIDGIREHARKALAAAETVPPTYLRGAVNKIGDTYLFDGTNRGDLPNLWENLSNDDDSTQSERDNQGERENNGCGSHRKFEFAFLASTLTLLVAIVSLAKPSSHTMIKTNYEVIHEGAPLLRTTYAPTSNPIESYQILEQSPIMDKDAEFVGLNTYKELVAFHGITSLDMFDDNHLKPQNLAMYTLAKISNITLSSSSEIIDFLQKYALLTFYFSTSSNSSWYIEDGWVEDSLACDGWHGITCNDLGYVVEIDLSGNNLSGTIPEEFSRGLRKLENINLANNSLVGEISSNVGTLTDLKWLNLANNTLHNTVPSSVGNLTKLEELLLHKNRLVGSIPTSFGLLTNIKVMNLENNLLGGTIPETLGSLHGMRELTVSGNLIKGDMPAGICVLGFMGELSKIEANCTLLDCNCCTRCV